MSTSTKRSIITTTDNWTRQLKYTWKYRRQHGRNGLTRSYRQKTAVILGRHQISEIKPKIIKGFVTVISAKQNRHADERRVSMRHCIYRKSRKRLTSFVKKENKKSCFTKTSMTDVCNTERAPLCMLNRLETCCCGMCGMKCKEKILQKYVVPGQFFYQGTMYNKPISSRSLQYMRHMTVHPDDVFITGYPKSGKVTSSLG